MEAHTINQRIFTVNVPVATMRRYPDSTAEVVSQAIYSEIVKQYASKGDWLDVSTEVDGYRGWVHRDALIEVEEFSDPVCMVARLAAHLYEVKDTIYGPILTLPFESQLKLIKEDCRWIQVQLLDGRTGYIQKGDVSFSKKPLSIDAMCEFSKTFLGLPYTWGGRSSFGYDCSGFVQMLFRQMGLYMPRDSSEQCSWDGLKNISPDQMAKGDLIFFGHSHDEIRHVGLSLGNEIFIHTCAVVENMPYVRLSSIKDEQWRGAGYYSYRQISRVDLQK